MRLRLRKEVMNMERKLSQEEIRIAAERVDAIYHSEGYLAAKEKAEKLIGRMIEHGNIDDESIYIFEKYSGMSYPK